MRKTPKINIDANMYKQIVEIVDQRPEKTQLSLILGFKGFTLGELPQKYTENQRVFVKIIRTSLEV